MKVASNTVYGPPSVIHTIDLPKPEPSKKQILIKIYYSSINRTDSGFLRAKPFLTRFFTGITKPKYISLGSEFSGIVDEVGSNVKLFKPGDMVFGFDDSEFGGYAEYKTIDEDKAVAKIPSNITLKQGAVSLEGAHYALFYIYKISDPKNTKVFVNGATGAIGSAAVQILKAQGYYVEASSTTKELKTVIKLGVNKVIDWQTEDISKKASPCDVYFDAVGKSSFKNAKNILKPGGLYMSSELGRFGQNPILSIINPLQKLITKRNIRFPLPITRKKEIITIANYIKSGKFKPLIDREYGIEDIVDGFEYVESGNKVGNVVVKIS